MNKAQDVIVHVPTPWKDMDPKDRRRAIAAIGGICLSLVIIAIGLGGIVYTGAMIIVEGPRHHVVVK